MEKIFINVLNMSLSASYVILVVIGIRFLIQRLPKVYAYLLWSVVWIRLVNPFKIESIISLVRINHQTIPEDIGYAKVPAIHSGIHLLNNSVNNALPPVPTDVLTSVNPMQVYLSVGSKIWIWGLNLLVVYMIFTGAKTYMKLKTAVRLFDNVYKTDAFKSPFVFGNRIYLTGSLDAMESDYILKHEQIHINRGDHIIKPIAFLVACVHWFNPFVWIAYILMERDMELSCDEGVINHSGNDIKVSYSESLLSFAGKNRILGSCPFTFGEKATVKRIKNILSYKKPPFWAMIVAFIAIGVLGISLLTTAKSQEQDSVYLKPEMLITSVYEQEKIKIDAVEYGGYTRISGTEVANWINETHWNVKKVKSPLELIPSYSLMNLMDSDKRSEIRLYESDPTLAMILYEDQWRYYEIEEADYDAMKSLIISRSYFEPYGEQVEAQSTSEPVKAPVNVVNVDIDMLFNEMMSSPATSSNPNDYIEAHPDVYEKILSYGDLALSYCFIEFEKGGQLGLKGHLMANVGKVLCNGEFDEHFETGQAWYDHFVTFAIAKRDELGEADFEKHMRSAYLLLSLREGKTVALNITEIPDFEYLGEDLYLDLVYKTEIQNQLNYKNRVQFLIPAVRVHMVSEEENQIKIFTTIYDAFYTLSETEVKNDAGSVVPVALTYQLEEDGGYKLLKYETARDGGEFTTSIETFCVTPITHKPIKGLSEKIIKHYSDYSDLRDLQRENLVAHLQRYGLHGIFLITDYDDTRIPLTD
ncbi:M56 family metallopeptidase [Fusibacter ferrireducens]|uniref:Peptidase M56 domain-containing protein n=1 Tax=Fusibacter ferrireducens TaxID=2785058 RepID=A0ABR9ZPL3_9FIRM|nr:M56 family metallopeptidase [Fusibacter ferrireducens]MBF4692407.1 hypothetical protein [Fusibacter ferrireducens]